MLREPPDRGRRRKLAAVVLARTNYGEADLIVTFLTRELGLVSALARYGRRSRRRFGGGLLAPGVSAWYEFTLKPQSTLAFVESAEDNPRA
ncbi:MAG: recombination protein O N-terminal domain-containing protein, partial [Candidatus Adiutrix sp.]|nr:recombination protein O N-terminal domain-containing protein [Candidatus Adiutrix sp.]